MSKGLKTLQIIALAEQLNRAIDLPMAGEKSEQMAFELLVLQADKAALNLYDKSLSELIEQEGEGLSLEQIAELRAAVAKVKLPGLIKLVMRKAIEELFAVIQRYAVVGNAVKIV